jgi:exodeoxyribonuclease-3
MNIISWNVNGIRAIEKKGAFGQLFDTNPDIVCLQETKAHKEQLSEKVKSPKGYKSFFHSATSRKGYSGVAIYIKEKIECKEIALKESFFKNDLEGRLITLEFKTFFLINCYFPNGGGEDHRLEYKLAFFDAFTKLVAKLQKDKPVIFCGDVNIAHTEVDLARPKDNIKSIGFLPQERAKIDALVELGFSDVHRVLFPDVRDVYTWWDMKTRSRDRNVGWRIDYFFVSKILLKKVESIKTHVDFLGSDHCPVEIVFK